MARNFGIVTGGSALRGIEQPTRPHIAPDTQRNNVIRLADHSPPGRLNLGGEVAAPFIPDEADKDFAALCFALAALTGPVMLLAFIVFAWVLFID